MILLPSCGLDNAFEDISAKKLACSVCAPSKINNYNVYQKKKLLITFII